MKQEMNGLLGNHQAHSAGILGILLSLSAAESVRAAEGVSITRPFAHTTKVLLRETFAPYEPGRIGAKHHGVNRDIRLRCAEATARDSGLGFIHGVSGRGGAGQEPSRDVFPTTMISTPLSVFIAVTGRHGASCIFAQHQLRCPAAVKVDLSAQGPSLRVLRSVPGSDQFRLEGLHTRERV